MGKSVMLDAVLIAFLLLSSWIGSRVGLIRSLFRLIRLFIACVGAFLTANLLSPVVSLLFLFDGVQKKFAAISEGLTENVFSSVSDGVQAFQAGAAQTAAALSELAQKAGLPHLMADSMAQKFLSAPPEAGETLLSAASRIVSDNIAYIVVFLLTFVIILIVTGFLLNWLSGLIHFIVPRFIDRFFGFFFGILIGCLWVSLFFQFAGSAVPALFQSGSLFSPDVVSHTFLASRLANINFLSLSPSIMNTSLLSGSE